MIRAYCYLTDEQAHYLSLSNEDRKKVPNRKAILESLCLFARQGRRGRHRNQGGAKEMTSAGDIRPHCHRLHPHRPRRGFLFLILHRFHSKVETPRPSIKQREDSRGRDHLDVRHGGGRPGNGFESHRGGRGFPLPDQPPMRGRETFAAARLALGQVRTKASPIFRRFMSLEATPFAGTRLF